MRKRSFMPIRLLAALLALLLVAFSLPVVPAQAAPKASETSADDDDISVLSVIVNTNSETNEVFTELVLQNKGSEDKQITFPLPEVYAGINTKTLTVRTANGEDLVHDSGTVTLDIQAGGFAGVSYTYKTKKNLVYEHLIGFDLKQLSALFSDRIGHLEWTVDMPLYEVILVNNIQPVNYTCNGRRISVQLDNFLVSRLLNQVYLERTTHKDLLEDIDNIDEVIETEKTRLLEIPDELAPLRKEGQELDDRINREVDWESIWEIGWENLDLEQRNYISGLQEQSEELWERINELVEERDDLEYQIAHRIANKFIIENYREWYKNPEEIRRHLEPDRGYTLLSMYLDRHYPPKDREMILGKLMIRDYSEVGDYSSELLYVFENMADYPDDDANLFKYLLWGMGFIDDPYYPWDVPGPAVRAMYYGEEQSVYAILPSGTKIDRSKTIIVQNDLGERSETFVSDINEYIIQRMEIDYYTPCRFAFISESEFGDIDMVLDYLDALHVKAIIRAELPERLFFMVAGHSYCSDGECIFGYDGTEEWPYEVFKQDFHSAYTYWELLPQYPLLVSSMVGSGISTLEDSRNVKEPLKDTFEFPIMTLYLGVIQSESETEIDLTSFLGKAPFRDGAVNNLMDLPIPKKMIDAHYEGVKAAKEETDRLLSQAAEALKLPEAPEAPTLALTEAPTQEIETTEPSTESGTEEMVASKEAETEATVESTEENLTEESTTAVADETETFASKDTKDPTDKGILVLLIAIVAGVVLAGAATAVVVVKKKSKAKE